MATVTLKDLASRLDLSASTVSRVLSDPTGDSSRWASAETTARVRALASELGYKRNLNAAMLRTSRSKMVGVIVPRLQDFVLAAIYEGISDAASEADYFSIVSNSREDEKNRQHMTERILEHRVAGFIFGDAHIDRPEFFSEFSKRDIPYVLTNRALPGEISVTCDDRAGGRLAAEHFLTLGCSSFAVLGGRSDTSTGRGRVEGFVEALREHGINDSSIRVVYRGFDSVDGREATEQLLDTGPPPDAIFAANDFAAIGAVGLLRERRIRVPEDLLICGYNDVPLAASVGLTSVHTPLFDLGRRSFELLHELIRGGAPASEVLAPTLVVRSGDMGTGESTDSSGQSIATPIRFRQDSY